jgi:outer membrane murein-binding lipoprotein Lpp
MQTQKSILAGIALSAILFSGCGGNKKSDTDTISKNDNVFTALDKLKNNSEKMQADMDESTKVQEERKKRGDTLAMNYKDLQKFLPESIDGYEKDGEPGGESVNMGGMSFSNAKQRFKKGEDDITVTITDYNQNYGAYQGLFALAGMYSVESDDQKTMKFSTGIARTIGIEDYKKKSKDATITIGAGYRFWIEARGNNQADAGFLKKVVAGMKLKELAEM